MTSLSAERLRELLHYEPATGLFFWLVVANDLVHVGDVAGHVRANGYRLIRVDGWGYPTHRLAWLWMTGEWPKASMDHADGDRANNRWNNLRQANKSQNGANSRRYASNTSGFKGVSRKRPSRHWRAPKWLAQISVNGKVIYLGYFDTPEDAHDAYIAAAKKYFGDFARAACGWGLHDKIVTRRG
jgi:hypothetical protein